MNRKLSNILLIAASIVTQSLEAKKEIKPNVVIFLTDDQGSIDVNRFGAKDLLTPNMDKLCETGVQLTQFYANSSISSPSRAALMTGRYPQRVGMLKLASSEKGIAGMPGNEITMAEVLRDNGYETALIGKWHLGYTPETMPQAQGFNYSFGHMGGCIDNYSHFFYWNGPNRHDLWRNGEEVYNEGENFSDLMVKEAIRFIGQNKKKPFFLYFSTNYPHYPLQGDQKWRMYYKNLPHPRDKYAAMVSTIDEKIGMVINKIEKEGLRKNTIIIFMSDNGHSTEERTFFGGGSAGELRGEKFSTYEGGIRVPAIISFPALLPQNTVCNEIGMGADWMPTIIDLCKINWDKSDFDGKSLVSMIKDKKSTPHDVIHWQVGLLWAVRKGDYKMVGKENKNGEIIELYNLNEDKRESRDLATTHRTIYNDLLKERELYKKRFYESF